MSVVSLHIECTDSIESILIMTYNMEKEQKMRGGGGGGGGGQRENRV